MTVSKAQNSCLASSRKQFSSSKKREIKLRRLETNQWIIRIIKTGAFKRQTITQVNMLFEINLIFYL